MLITPPFAGTFCRSVGAQSTAQPWRENPLPYDDETNDTVLLFPLFRTTDNRIFTDYSETDVATDFIVNLLKKSTVLRAHATSLRTLHN